MRRGVHAVLLVVLAACGDEPTRHAACTAVSSCTFDGARATTKVAVEELYEPGQGTCAMGVCVVSCVGGGGCASDEVCTSPPASTRIGVCAPGCEDGCPDGLECGYVSPFARACLPPGASTFADCAAPGQSSAACDVIGADLTCVGDRCLDRCNSNGECLGGVCAQMLAGVGACLATCSDGICPEGLVCDVDLTGTRVCVPEVASCANLVDNAFSCGACKLFCPNGTCSDGHCDEGSVTITSPFVERRSAGIARRFSAAVVLPDRSVLVIGGEDEVGALAAIERYEPDIDRWSLAGQLPFPRVAPAAAVIDGQLIVVGGRDASGIPTSTMFVVPLADLDGSPVFSLGPPLATPRAHASAGVVGGALLVVGGVSTGGQVLADAEHCTTVTCNPAMALPAPRARASSATVGDALLVAGGITPSGDSALDVYIHRVTAVETLAPLVTNNQIPRPAVDGVAVGTLDGRALLFGGAMFDPPQGTYEPGLGRIVVSTLATDDDDLTRRRGMAMVGLADGRVVGFGGESADGTTGDALIIGDVRARRIDDVRLEIVAPSTYLLYLDDVSRAPIAGPRATAAPFELTVPRGSATRLIAITPFGRHRVELSIPN